MFLECEMLTPLSKQDQPIEQMTSFGVEDKHSSVQQIPVHG